MCTTLTYKTESQIYKKKVILFIAVVQIAENSIQSVLFPKTYDPPLIANAQTTATNSINHKVSETHTQLLHSASTSELIVPHPHTVHSTIGDRASCVTAAWAWKTLTLSVQSSESQVYNFSTSPEDVTVARPFVRPYSSYYRYQLVKTSIAEVCGLSTSVRFTFVDNP